MQLFLVLLLAGMLVALGLVNSKAAFREQALLSAAETALVHVHALTLWRTSIHQTSVSTQTLCLPPAKTSLLNALYRLDMVLPKALNDAPPFDRASCQTALEGSHSSSPRAHLDNFAAAELAVTGELLQTLLASNRTVQHNQTVANLTGLLALLVVGLITFELWRRKHEHAQAQLAAHLGETRKQYQRSQNVLLSIMEDTREKSEKATSLANENRHLAAIVQHSDSAILKLAGDGTVLHANPSAERHFEFAHSTADGSRKLAPTVAQFVLPLIQRMTRSSPPARTTISVIQPQTGSEVHLSVMINQLVNDLENRLEFSLVASDVTYLHQAKENLRQVIEQTPSALIMADAGGTISLCNSEAAKMFGYAPKDMIGEPIELLVPSDAKRRHPHLRGTFFNKPTPRAMDGGRDLTAQRKNGELFPVEIGLNPLATAEGVYVIASVVDLTDRLKNQQHLEFMNAELQQRNFEMEQFTYTVSHDLKAPLVTIAGFADQLAESLAEHTTERQRHQFERIKVNIKQMESLLADLVELSRVVKGNFTKALVDTDALMSGLLASLEGDIEHAQAQIQIATPLQPIWANDRLLQQCIQNLLTNALKYREPNRPLWITVATVRNPAATDISISDNGVGIDAKYHEKIFRIFERLNVGEGTGIGLTIVKTAMEKHGGTILLQSTLNKGSTFTLRFPNPPGALETL